MLPAAVRNLRRRGSWNSCTLAESVLPLSNRVTNKSLQVVYCPVLVLEEHMAQDRLHSRRSRKLRLSCLHSGGDISAFILVMCN